MNLVQVVPCMNATKLCLDALVINPHDLVEAISSNKQWIFRNISTPVAQLEITDHPCMRTYETFNTLSFALVPEFVEGLVHLSQFIFLPR